MKRIRLVSDIGRHRGCSWLVWSSLGQPGTSFTCATFSPTPNSYAYRGVFLDRSMRESQVMLGHLRVVFWGQTVLPQIAAMRSDGQRLIHKQRWSPSLRISGDMGCACYRFRWRPHMKHLPQRIHSVLVPAKHECLCDYLSKAKISQQTELAPAGQSCTPKPGLRLKTSLRPVQARTEDSNSIRRPGMPPIPGLQPKALLTHGGEGYA